MGNEWVILLHNKVAADCELLICLKLHLNSKLSFEFYALELLWKMPEIIIYNKDPILAKAVQSFQNTFQNKLIAQFNRFRRAKIQPIIPTG